MVAVLFHHVVVGHDELPVPSRVGGVESLVEAAAAGRVCQADARSGLEHQDVHEILNYPIVHRLSVPHAGKTFEERIAAAFLPGEFEGITVRENGAFVVVGLGAKLHPHGLSVAPAAGEVKALVSGAVDVAGPKAAEPAALMHMLVRGAAEVQVEIPGVTHGEPSGAFHVKVRRGRLVQYSLLVVEFRECHRRAARLEEGVTIRKLGFAVEDVLEVQPSVGGNKQAARAGAMPKIPDSVIACAMAALRGIVANDGNDFPSVEGCVRHAAILPSLHRRAKRRLRACAWASY